MLALYYSSSCIYCWRVRHAISSLKIGDQVELRSIGEAEHREALQAARGRTTVPVLRISEGEGDDVWMPESADIVAYLNERWGR